MPTHSSNKDLSLKWLELFQTYARTQSLQATAAEADLSISTVSHHLRNLEEHLGIALFDHSRRPMVITPTGRNYLRNIAQAMQTIRKATAEASAGNVADASYLRVGTIEDLDSDVTPELAVYLSQNMPDCNFLYHTGTSNDIIRMLRHRELDLGVVTTPLKSTNDLVDWPLLRDPFVIALPVSMDLSLPDIVEGRINLPFLQFSSDLIIAAQIEAQLRRLGVQLPNKFECGNNQTLMAMVAAGSGWTITTPLMFSRARRFHKQLRLHPFPGKSFGRTLSLVASPDCAQSAIDLVAFKLRIELNRQILSGMHRAFPWLNEQFTLIE